VPGRGRRLGEDRAATGRAPTGDRAGTRLGRRPSTGGAAGRGAHAGTARGRAYLGGVGLLRLLPAPSRRPAGRGPGARTSTAPPEHPAGRAGYGTAGRAAGRGGAGRDPGPAPG